MRMDAEWRRERGPSLILVACALAACALLAPGGASAGHQAGVTYSGTTTDAGVFGPVSGTVELEVSADGNSVTRFAVNFVMPALPFGPAACAGTTISSTFTGSVPITPFPGVDDLHVFDSSPLDAPEPRPLDFDGGIGLSPFSPNALNGRFSYEDPAYPNSGCTTGGGVGFTGSPKCMQAATLASAQAEIARLQGKIKKLKAKIKTAKQAGATDKVKKLKKKLKAQKRKLAEAQDVLLPSCPAS